MQHHTQRGFTLVELAIALMVIGLLIGGVLKGQELIENARITRFAKDLSDYDAAVMIFESSYGGLPGDIKKPNRIPNCNTAPCNTVVANFTGNGRIDDNRKSAVFWMHLERAGLISGINEETYNVMHSYKTISPKTPFDGYLIAFYRRPSSSYYTNGWYNPNLESNGLFPDSGDTWSYLACSRIAALDEKLDDGKPTTGMVIVMATSALFECMENEGGTAIYKYTADKKNMIKVSLSSINR